MNRNFLRWTGAILPLFAAAHIAGAQTLPTAASLMSKYATAIGGPAYVNAKAIVVEGGMSMPAAGLNASFEMKQLAPNQMQMITTIPGMGEVQVGYDGTTAWAMDPMQGPRVLAGAELAQMKDESDRRSSIRSAEMFSAMETMKDTTMNNERCYLVKLTWKSGRESYDCYSAATGLITAARSTQKTAMGDIPVVTTFHEYKKFGGITVATKTVQELMGQQQILTIGTVDFPADVAGIVIAPPDQVKALIKK